MMCEHYLSWKERGESRQTLATSVHSSLSANTANAVYKQKTDLPTGCTWRLYNQRFDFA